MLDLTEVLAAETEQRGPVELRIAANEVVRVRVERLAVLVAPDLLGVVAGVEVHRLGVPVLELAGHEAAALGHEDAFARRRQRVQEGAAPGARADDDDVVVGGHGFAPCQAARVAAPAVHFNSGRFVCMSAKRQRKMQRL